MKSVKREILFGKEAKRKKMEMLGMDIKAIKMRTNFYEKVGYEVRKINNENMMTPLEKFNGIPIIIDDTLDKDYEFVLRNDKE